MTGDPLDFGVPLAIGLGLVVFRSELAAYALERNRVVFGPRFKVREAIFEWAWLVLGILWIVLSVSIFIARMTSPA